VIETRRNVQVDAALASELPDARAREQALRCELEEGEAQVAAAVAASTAEVAACEQALQALELQLGQELRDLDAALAAIAERLCGLPPLPDPAIAAATVKAAQEAQQGMAEAERRHIAAVSAAAATQGQLQAARAALDGLRDVRPAIGHQEAEVAMWSALSKGLGPDGVVALCIDDVGPTLSSLANELLLSCYGPRFTVSIATQIESAKKELKEGFDIIVFDAQTHSAKSVSLMSGGERIWINAALTRAIAIYLAQSAGQRYQALFTDEADGPLDVERKRMFVAMKREVLRLGGHEQEFWVSHTPELWTLADLVIDLESLGQSIDSGLVADAAA
jgi:exonuclease SbcC